MNVDRYLRLIAGLFIMLSVALGWFVSPYWYLFTAFVGLNLFRGRATGDRIVLDAGGELAAAGAGAGPGDVIAVVHPHAIALHRSRPEVSARNVWATTVDSLDFEGNRVRVRLRGPVDLVAEVTPGAVADLGLAPGIEVWASVKATEVQVSPA